MYEVVSISSSTSYLLNCTAALLGGSSYVIANEALADYVRHLNTIATFGLGASHISTTSPLLFSIHNTLFVNAPLICSSSKKSYIALPCRRLQISPKLQLQSVRSHLKDQTLSLDLLPVISKIALFLFYTVLHLRFQCDCR